MLFERAAVIGVGLIGGSLALAARKRGLIGEIVGVGRSEANLAVARDRDLVDRTTSDYGAVGQVDLIVLAVPVRSSATVMRALAPGMKTGTIVSDVGSVKQWVVTEVESELPTGCSFVGAHPVAGSEQVGAAAAREDLFEDSVCVVTPTAATSVAAVDAVTALWVGVGAEVRRMTPTDHDRALAWTSHLGHALSYAVARSLGVADEQAEVLDLAGPSLRDLTRMAGGSAAMWRDIFLANDAAVLDTIDGFGAALAELRAAIESGDEKALDALLELGLRTRKRIAGER